MAKKGAEQNSPEREPTLVAPELSKAERWGAIILGALILVTGSVAVFVVDRDWGPVALIIVGSVLLLTGVVGRLPYVQWGDKVLDYRKPLEQAIKALRSPAEERAGMLEELEKTVPPSLAPLVRSITHEAEVIDALRTSLPRNVALADGITARGAASDAVLIDNRGRKAVVEVKYGKLGNRAEVFRRMLEGFKAADTQIVGGILVHTDPVAEWMQDELRRSGWEPVRVDDPGDPLVQDAIREAVDRVFPQAGS